MNSIFWNYIAVYFVFIFTYFAYEVLFLINVQCPNTKLREHMQISSLSMNWFVL